VITAAAICPCPPLLARELAGRAEVLPEMRAACAAAAGRLVASAPDLVVVTGADEETARWPADGRLDVSWWAPALATQAAPATGAAGGGPAARGSGPALPLSLGLGARLLDEAGYRGPRAYQGIAASAAPAACLRLGAELARSAPRTAFLAMGDGSARRSVAAPGHLDERAAPFDAAVERAVRDSDFAALAALDPALAADLLASGRPGWQVLAGALDGPRPPAGPVPGDQGPGPRTAEILYWDAPLGVGYLVAVITPE
jgi:hypothetical protein